MLRQAREGHAHQVFVEVSQSECDNITAATRKASNHLTIAESIVRLVVHSVVKRVGVYASVLLQNLRDTDASFLVNREAKERPYSIFSGPRRPVCSPTLSVLAYELVCVCV